MNVIRERANGKIELVSHTHNQEFAKVHWIFNAHELKNVIARINKLPKKPAIKAPIELTSISWKTIFLGQKLIFCNNNILKLLLK